MVLLAGGAAAAALQGSPTVIDGQTIEVGGKSLRLYGIRAPALDERCRFQDRSIACGRISRTALLDLTAGATVRCTLRAQRRDGPPAAVCHAGGYDLSEGMTYTGWARADRAVTDTYLRFERDARKHRRGMWRGAPTNATDTTN